MTGQSYWMASTRDPDYPALEGEHFASVAVVGAGIVGLTTAFLLKQAGLSVAVLEAGTIGCGVSGHTTGKVTAGHGLTYSRLEREHGAETSRLYAESQAAAVDAVAHFVRDLDVECDLERVSNYAFAERAEELPLIEAEIDAYRRAGLDARYAHDFDVPFAAVAAVCLSDQLQFHPRKYLLGLGRAVRGDGGSVFQNTRVTGIHEGSVHRVETRDGALLARHVVVATHVPITSKGWTFARVRPRRSYVIAAPVSDGALEGMWINVGSATRSLRTTPNAEGGRMLLVVGEGHRVGEDGDALRHYGELEGFLHWHFPETEVGYRWSTQDAYPVDGLPLVGRAGRRDSRLHVATGFGGWGLSNGTLAGMLLADAILERSNPWSALYDPRRSLGVLGRSMPRLVLENAGIALELVGGRLRKHQASIGDVRAGEGRIVQIDGGKVAVHRDDDGTVHAVSATCTHMGCVVGWNSADRTWDCACHGSRFGADGDVLEGPATTPLETVDLGVRVPVH